MNRIENEPRPRRILWITAGAIALAVAAFLAFGVFGVQTLFVDDVVAESGPVFDEVIDSAPTTTINDTNAADAADGATASTAALPGAASTSTTPASTAPVTAPQPAAIASGTFEAVDHDGQGRVIVIGNGVQTFVRFEEDFQTENGPDLYAVAYVGDQLIELGRLKGNQGSQNYELPANIDPASVASVAVWCKRFDSVFTKAALTA